MGFLACNIKAINLQHHVFRYESKDLKHDTNKVCNFVMENSIARMFVATLKMLFSDTVLEL